MWGRRLSPRVLALAAGLAAAAALAVTLGHNDARADQLPPPSFDFATGAPNGLMAMASCLSCGGSAQEHEAADDFVLSRETDLTSAKFTGLLPSGALLSDVTDVRVEIYRIFPSDSDTVRTITVPTRTNSPADVAFTDRDNTASTLSFTATVLAGTFNSNNSVLDGIHPKPNQTTGGDGSISGQEVQFSASFATPIDLAAGHYFFVPQVQLTSGTFYWLSGPRPITSPAGTPFTPDLQTWIRDASLDPDWLRVGTDIVGGATPPTFNGSFSLHGDAVCPAVTIDPSTLPGATLGADYSASFSASGDPGPFSFTETGALPSGMSFSADGSLTGTPTQAGDFPITVTASSADGCGATEQVTLTVTAAGTTTTPTTTTTTSTTTTTPLPTTPLPTTPPPTTTSGTAVPPEVSAVAQSHGRWREGSRLVNFARTLKAPVGTTFSFALNEQAQVSFTFTQQLPGRRVKNRCVVPNKRSRRNRSCTRPVTRGALTFAAHSGLNKVFFQGRVSRTQTLQPGRYTLSINAISPTGRSNPGTLGFTIVR